MSLVPCLAYSTLKFVVACSSETSVDSQQTRRHYIEEERFLVSSENVLEMYSLPKRSNDIIGRYVFVNAVSTANLWN